MEKSSTIKKKASQVITKIDKDKDNQKEDNKKESFSDSQKQDVLSSINTLIKLLLHKEKTENEKEKLKFMKDLSVHLKKSFISCEIHKNQTVIPSLLQLIEWNLSKNNSSFIVYNYLTKSIEKDFLTFDDIGLIEEANVSNFKVKSSNTEQLNLVYDILVIVINKSENDILNKFISDNLISLLIVSLNSYDKEHRLIARLLLFRIIQHFINRRKLILLLFEDYVLNVNSSLNINPFGYFEIFDFFSAIFKGLSKPVKFIFIDYFRRVILSILKTSCLKTLWTNYKSMLLSIIEHEPDTFAPVVVSSLFKTWPSKSTEKISLYIDLIESLIDINSKLVDKSVMCKLYRKILTCLKSDNGLISSKALSLLMKKTWVMTVVIRDYMLGDVLLENVLYNIKNHWCEDIEYESERVLLRLKDDFPDIISKTSEETQEYIRNFSFKKGEVSHLLDYLNNYLKGD